MPGFGGNLNRYVKRYELPGADVPKLCRARVDQAAKGVTRRFDYHAVGRTDARAVFDGASHILLEPRRGGLDTGVLNFQWSVIDQPRLLDKAVGALRAAS
jgi:hypothetical protein